MNWTLVNKDRTILGVKGKKQSEKNWYKYLDNETNEICSINFKVVHF